nr:uncharacterized protein LOC105878294 [Microcebus murinus]
MQWLTQRAQEWRGYCQPMNCTQANNFTRNCTRPYVDYESRPENIQETISHMQLNCTNSTCVWKECKQRLFFRGNPPLDAQTFRLCVRPPFALRRCPPTNRTDWRQPYKCSEQCLTSCTEAVNITVETLWQSQGVLNPNQTGVSCYQEGMRVTVQTEHDPIGIKVLQTVKIPKMTCNLTGAQNNSGQKGIVDPCYFLCYNATKKGRGGNGNPIVLISCKYNGTSGTLTNCERVFKVSMPGPQDPLYYPTYPGEKWLLHLPMEETGDPVQCNASFQWLSRSVALHDTGVLKPNIYSSFGAEEAWRDMVENYIVYRFQEWTVVPVQEGEIILSRPRREPVTIIMALISLFTQVRTAINVAAMHWAGTVVTAVGVLVDNEGLLWESQRRLGNLVDHLAFQVQVLQARLQAMEYVLQVQESWSELGCVPSLCLTDIPWNDTWGVPNITQTWKEWDDQFWKNYGEARELWHRQFLEGRGKLAKIRKDLAQTALAQKVKDALNSIPKWLWTGLAVIIVLIIIIQVACMGLKMLTKAIVSWAGFLALQPEAPRDVEPDAAIYKNNGYANGWRDYWQLWSGGTLFQMTRRP